MTTGAVCPHCACCTRACGAFRVYLDTRGGSWRCCSGPLRNRLRAGVRSASSLILTHGVCAVGTFANKLLLSPQWSSSVTRRLTSFVMTRPPPADWLSSGFSATFLPDNLQKFVVQLARPQYTKVKDDISFKVTSRRLPWRNRRLALHARSVIPHGPGGGTNGDARSQITCVSLSRC